MENWLLTIILFIPLAGALFVLLSPSESHGVIRRISLWTMVADLVLGIVLFFQFDPNLYEMQFTELKARWFDIGGLTVNYSVGMDGISFLLVELTLLLGPVVILSSWSAIQERVKEYHILLLILQTGMIGAFVALDFFLFYVFWELMLIPMYFLIGVWGGARKIYAAIKFFLFTMAGSVLMLVAIVYVVIQPELRTFDIVTITNSLDRPSSETGSADPSLCRLRRRLCHQSAHVSLPHMASRCPRGGPHCRVRDPRRGAPQDGNLWVYPLCHASLSLCGL